jgi:alpha-tubulin suppressor-like RCC1 family protein
MRRFTMTGLCLVCLALFGALAASAASAASPGIAAWGSNSLGQLGNGTTENSLEPAPVSGVTEVLAVAGGGEFSLALLANGTVMSWGANNAGQLGDGSTTPSSVPVPVSGLSNVVAIAAGGEHALALLSNGHVMAWGQNATGQLGNGKAPTSSDVPVEVSEISEVTAIAAGGKHSLALLSDHRVEAWGADKEGQLGNGHSGSLATGYNTPVEVTELGGVTAIAAGGLHSLALLENGTVESWGSNTHGQLGNESKNLSSTAVAVKGLIGVKAIAAGQSHSMALLNSGEVWDWGGGGSGDLGNGAEETKTTPVQATGLTEVTAISAGSNYSAALLASGNVSEWGANNEGQLGDGVKTRSALPLTNADIHSVAGISAGGSHMLVAGPQLPSVTAVAPAKGPPSGSTSVTITGTHFASVSAVHFGANAATEFKVESETTIQAVSPAGTGIVNVTVTIPAGTSPDSAANAFSYAPVVSGIAPAAGTQEGGTKVVISGSNFEGVSAVSFGATAAASFKVESSSEIVAFSPAGVGTVDVTITGPGGTSATLPADQFNYTSSPPELGRCVKVAKKGSPPSGAYSEGSCITAAPGNGKFEWMPGPGAKPGFLLKAQKGLKILFETVAHKVVQCGNARGEGSYSGSKSITNFKLRFTGCTNGVQCTSPGQEAGKRNEGVVNTSVLSGHLGVITIGKEPQETIVGFDISAPGKGTVMEFECGTEVKYVWHGGLILPWRTTDKMSNKFQVKFLEDKGHQNIESFENEPKEVLFASINGAPAEQGGMTATFEVKNKEKSELNLLH